MDLQTQGNKTILIDLDDVLTDMVSEWVRWLNILFNLSVDYRQIKDWNMSLTYPTLANEEIFKPLNSEGFWKKVHTRTDAIKYVKKLYDECYNIYIVTATKPHLMEYKMKYCINPYFPYIDDNHIIISSNKQMIKGDVLIDDNPNNLVGGEYKKILFNKSHNVNDRDNPDFHCADDWEEVYKIIKEIL